MPCTVKEIANVTSRVIGPREAAAAAAVLRDEHDVPVRPPPR